VTKLRNTNFEIKMLGYASIAVHDVA